MLKVLSKVKLMTSSNRKLKSVIYCFGTFISMRIHIILLCFRIGVCIFKSMEISEYHQRAHSYTIVINVKVK